MNSSLLPNDIEDLDGLELKDQVTKIKEYIEYMREQLQWYSSVTDKAEGGFVQSVTTYYGVSSSPTTPPSSWSTECPQIEDGEYLWEYTKVKRSGITTRSEPVCITTQFEAGEDAAIVYIHSSNGTIFRADNTGTVLTVTVYYGSDAIRTLANLQTAFGSNAHLDWYERAYGSATDTPISPSDSRISDNGFTLTLTAADVDDRATYSCRLMLSVSETRAQGAITITDIEDGLMLYATSSTASSTAAKTATLQSGTLDLTAGATVAVTFEHANTAANPTLNIDGTGAKTIRAGNSSLAASSIYNWTDNATVIFIYDGTYWQMDGTAQLEKADDARRVATDYITDVGNTGIEVSGNNATSKVQIEDTVKVITDSTHFAEMTATQFKIHSGNVLFPTSYLGTRDAAFAGDGAGHYLVRIYEFNPSSLTAGGALELRNVDGRTRVRLDAYGDYGSQLFYNANADCMVSIGSAIDGSYGALQLFQTTTAISQGFYNGATLGKVIGSMFVNTGTPALLIYEEPTPSGSGYTTNLSAAYGGGAAYIRSSSTFAGYVVHGKTINHRLTFDWDTISGYNYLRFWIDSVEVARIQQQSYSDRRVKTDIEPIKDGYKEAVAAVDIDQFRYDFGDTVRQGANGIMFGIVAQDLIEKLDDNGIDFKKTPLVANIDNDDESLYSVDYTQFLLARLAADEDRIRELETRLEALERR